MADHADESSQWIRSLVAGDDRVVTEFWQTYAPALRRLANKQMSPALKQRVDPDDVVQSACRTFFRRARQDQFQLEDSAALWRLLCAVTLTKVRQHARFHLRKCRGMDREMSINASESGGIASPVDPGPAPDEAVAFADQLQHLFQELDDEELRLIQLKLEGRDHEQIASILQCSTRSVRRLLAKIRDRWEREIQLGILELRDAPWHGYVTPVELDCCAWSDGGDRGAKHIVRRTSTSVAQHTRYDGRPRPSYASRE